ncbi:MAG: phytanoyl-CoA dioxygenase family protein [Nitrosotalea sp.]
MTISSKIVEKYRKDGIAIVPSFYDIETEILPIQKDIYKIISILIKQNKLSIRQKSFSSLTFDSGLQDILKINRSLVSQIYDAVKKIPSYVKLACFQKNEEVARTLLNTEFVGFAPRGYGIRMDNPFEDKYLTQWHQDYVSQLCAKNGIVLWSPLRNVTLDMGPVEFCLGSHKDGIFRIVQDGGGSYGLKVKDEDKIVKRYTSIIPEVKVGDLVVSDYLALHRSTHNHSKYTRWAMISRYFDFLDPVGISYGWKGGLQEGNSFEKIHPELSEIVGINQSEVGLKN